ncbi:MULTISPECIES: FAD-dependent oxidoreductase [unclassified Leeuwenhoekiella]|uniref:NAD(P)/FAD-dependent oxidoreductase n=1 Tax=unclassified Leeuwenhoekiella TaxID=2615029 RepID=UPI000C383F90|nr:MULTISPECIES: FAD-dependent oxidoreductase [unclassified Leeuwenhoekiella]MBA80468.1 FAD-dependent oxidoreductase [Leeuwenhoekiella sp.]|tara:strand:+ start:56394 stop:57680 length:1287 start_codon:yes stop_codon:yes gene_type:complete
MEHVVIVGNGIAGVTAARHIRKHSDKKITIISAESDHFFSRTALMYVYMGHMRFKDLKPYEDHFWSKNDIALKNAYVEEVDTDEKLLYLAQGEKIAYDTLILATGSIPAKYGWEGQNLQGVQGLVSKQDLELLEQNAPNNEVCPKAVIVGGGLIGVELAEMLHTRKIEVTILVREHAFWSGVLPDGEAEMISRHIKSHGIDLRHEEELDAILDDGKGKVRGIRTKKGEEIPCNLVGITTGVKPQIKFLEHSKIETDKGILVNRKLETNIKDVYAIGDCAQQREAIGLRKPVEAVWYTGRMMGETVAQTICGKPFEYNPGNWFNSAKFMDIEYQTYGWVFSTKNKKAYEQHFHWKHPDDTKCITIAYHKDTKEFLGINTFGIRMKHEVFDTWLNEKRDVDYVVQHLKEANFDPEFYRHYESQIQNQFKA